MKTKGVAATLALCALLYWWASSVTFALRHPELTQTQSLLRTWDALRWE